jgi:amino acid transporter
MSPGEVLAGSGSVGISLIMWVACGAISCIGALCCLELGLLYPESGGAYIYIDKGLGDFFRKRVFY